MLSGLTFVLGGAASGKSSFAESLLLAHADHPVYIATAQAFDDEMRQKIQRHQAQRTANWTLIEAPLDLPAALGRAADAPVLIDCATLWLSNHLLADSDLSAQTARLCTALTDHPAPVVVVSNEVGQGVVPDTSLGRAFREAQGRLNIALAGQADLVVQVVAGLPNVLKGVLP